MLSISLSPSLSLSLHRTEKKKEGKFRKKVLTARRNCAICRTLRGHCDARISKREQPGVATRRHCAGAGLWLWHWLRQVWKRPPGRDTSAGCPIPAERRRRQRCFSSGAGQSEEKLGKAREPGPGLPWYYISGKAAILDVCAASGVPPAAVATPPLINNENMSSMPH